MTHIYIYIMYTCALAWGVFASSLLQTPLLHRLLDLCHVVFQHLNAVQAARLELGVDC